MKLRRHVQRDQGRNQVYGIRDHKSWDQDQPFFVCVFEGSGVELFRYLIIDEKLECFVLQGKRPLVRSIEKALTWLYNILELPSRNQQF